MPGETYTPTKEECKANCWIFLQTKIRGEAFDICTKPNRRTECTSACSWQMGHPHGECFTSKKTKKVACICSNYGPEACQKYCRPS